MGEPKKAIETYKAGLKIFPSDFLIHYNLAITYNKIGELDEARSVIKKIGMLNPHHAVSHLLLGDLYLTEVFTRRQPPGSSVRFLVLEPNRQRSEAALACCARKCRAGVSAGKNENEIKIFMDASPKKDEGDFGVIDFAIGLTKAAEKTEKNKDKT